MGLRWQPFVVAAGLLAPPVALAVAVWPASASDGSGEETDASLAVGEETDGTVAGDGVVSFEVTATDDGPVRIDVLGRGSDPTLRIVDEGGSELAFNDDSNGLDPSIEVDLEDGQVVHAEVRSFNGDVVNFTIRVRDGDGGADDEGDDGGDGAEGPDTTLPGDVEAFVEPLGDEPIEIEGPGGVSITLRDEGRGGVCLDVQHPDGGSGTCATSLADLQQSGGFGGSFDGRVSILDVVSLVGPEVASAVAIDLDDDETELTILAIPGRVEQFVVGRIRIPGDAFSRPGGSGFVIELRDADGAAIDAFPA